MTLTKIENRFNPVHRCWPTARRNCVRLWTACAFCLAVASCAHGPRHAASVERSTLGYMCVSQQSGPFGIVEASIRIRDGEGPAGYVKWHVVTGSITDPSISAAWFLNSERRFEIDNGYASVVWHIWQIDGRRRDPDDKLSLEFRVDDSEHRFGSARLSSPYERSGGPFYITVDWSLLYALAAGTDDLYLIAKDEENAERLRVPIDPQIFVRAQPAAIVVMRDIETKIANPASRCDRYDFGADDDIVVT
jgi:hypothetical protein